MKASLIVLQMDERMPTRACLCSVVGKRSLISEIRKTKYGKQYPRAIVEQQLHKHYEAIVEWRIPRSVLDNMSVKARKN